MYDIFYIGDDELIITLDGGTYVVRESYEDYEVVFRGKYADCWKYVQDRWCDYQESIIG